MNEAETRAELIDLDLKESGWGVIEGSRIMREYKITEGKIQTGGRRSKPLIADYVLVYKNVKLAVIEAKSDEHKAGEGVTQAKEYADKLHLDYAFATNGVDLYMINMITGKEQYLERFPTPDELYDKIIDKQNKWIDKFNSIPFEDLSGTRIPRFYQEIAVNKTLKAVAEGKNRILLTLATGTGKTFIAFQIAWKLFNTRWNIKLDETRRPRILFLADRNILADQAFNSFSAFAEDALKRISPGEIRKKGKVPKNASIFFTIFQTFMSGGSASSPTNSVNTIINFSEIKITKKSNAYMYILQCADGSLYTGSTKELQKRVAQHKAGNGAKYTKHNLPIKLVYYESFYKIDEAFKREKQIQNWSRVKKTALIQGNINLLKQLSKNKTEYKNAELVEATEHKNAELVEAYFGEYPPDFFDFIIIDECHRGGANDESNWRDIMEYFEPAVQLGLTATPKRKDNVDTYKYFGEPVYIYSLKEGINDGYLTPFKVKRIQTTLDEYIYTSDDTIIEGDVEEGRIYEESDFNRIIEIKEREEKRVKIILGQINQKEKTLVFCATQDHALAIRDLINQYKDSTDPNYCHRVTANDGKLGEKHLRTFQDNEKTIPTILTTSQKLSTGVDAKNVRNIVLLRPVNSMIEFKQIIGRGTRLFEGKEFFTIYDFVGAYHHFLDPEWDGEPIEPVDVVEDPKVPDNEDKPKKKEENEDGEKKEKKKILKIKLADGKEREIQHMVSTSYWSPDGKPISADEFLESLYGKLPDFFNNEDELRKIWSNPQTRKAFLINLEEVGYGINELTTLQKMVGAENSDLYDVLEYISFAIKPISREERVLKAKKDIFKNLDDKQKEFLEFVLSKYIETGVEELDQDKLPTLLELKYNSVIDAIEQLGGKDKVKNTFIDFQKYLYSSNVA